MAKKFCVIFTLLLSYVVPVVKISQNFVAFSEYMNFTYKTKENSKNLYKSSNIDFFIADFCIFCKFW